MNEKDILFSTATGFKNGAKKRKLIAGECLPIENRRDLSKDLEITFWTVMDIG